MLNGTGCRDKTKPAQRVFPIVYAHVRFKVSQRN
jgi:hypothetical protein